ncbi:MAG: YigZ family protein [Halobellus sp.]|uniref:IMPACT family protein n=1 Tax=Halobellus sp. TaxID=1979212 RepID=UPI0035D41A59
MTDSSEDTARSDHPDAFRTVAGPGEAAFEIRGSEFVGYVAPANTVEEAEAFVEQIRDRHSDATHNVPAYRAPAVETEERGPSEGSGAMLREYRSDDGEPSGSAGDPALNVLVQQELRNVVAVVTRYYGGTNLGVGGLARAYSRGVKDAVDAAGVVETVPHERFAVTVDYDDSGTVRGLIESADVAFDADYGTDVSFEVRAAVEEAAALRDRIRSATSGRANIDH